MRKLWYVAIVVVLAMIVACAGVVKEGAPCDNPGDVYAKDGKVLSCVEPKNGGAPIWRK